jgi:hypothetical protein
MVQPETLCREHGVFLSNEIILIDDFFATVLPEEAAEAFPRYEHQEETSDDHDAIVAEIEFFTQDFCEFPQPKSGWSEEKHCSPERGGEQRTKKRSFGSVGIGIFHVGHMIVQLCKRIISLHVYYTIYRYMCQILHRQKFTIKKTLV